MYKIVFTFFVVCLITVRGAVAHEFWIEPDNHILPEDSTITANLMVGQNYSGLKYGYIPQKFHAFTITGAGGTQDVPGTVGNLPAMVFEPADDGLHIVSYHSTADQLTFDNFEKFSSYVIAEGSEWAVEEHRARGLPDSGFTEDYTRCAKALIQMGAYDGTQDRETGMPLELVALQSPYGPGIDGEIEVRLVEKGIPVKGQRINVFIKGNAAEPRKYTTDDDGRAVIDVSQPGRYLLNSVVISPVTAEDGVAWESFWASMTFEIPAAD